MKVCTRWAVPRAAAWVFIVLAIHSATAPVPVAVKPNHHILCAQAYLSGSPFQCPSLR